MIVVTGGAGFIGSNLVRGLNRQGAANILVVDDLSRGEQFLNLVDCDIADYWDKDLFRERLRSGLGFKPLAVFHQGACAVTTEWDGRFMMDTNYQYSKELLEFCLGERVALLYASSAAVYGGGRSFKEDASDEAPLNVYGYSKLLLDRYVRRRLPAASSQVVGLRYFNVYGPGEAHKGPMASVAYHVEQQVAAQGEARLFEGSHGYGPGEQRRDFVHVDDVVAVNLWFFEHPERSGVFNVGTGRSETFNALAQAVIDWHGSGRIRYIPFPDGLKERYQSFTEANIEALRDAGYRGDFQGVREGIHAYLGALKRRR
jgi:ADP-L-glycero-D-manno-heptose 6-epimerase